MSDISRQEFEDLKKQVRTPELKVEKQPEDIATLCRRTTTHAGGSTTTTTGSSDDDETLEFQRAAVELDVIDILRTETESGPYVDVETIKSGVADRGHLRSKAKAVVRNWINRGYLSGDIDDRVKVNEWPLKTKPLDE